MLFVEGERWHYWFILQYWLLYKHPYVPKKKIFEQYENLFPTQYLQDEIDVEEITANTNEGSIASDQKNFHAEENEAKANPKKLVAAQNVVQNGIRPSPCIRWMSNGNTERKQQSVEGLESRGC